MAPPLRPRICKPACRRRPRCIFALSCGPRADKTLITRLLAANVLWYGGSGVGLMYRWHDFFESGDASNWLECRWRSSELNSAPDRDVQMKARRAWFIRVLWYDRQG